LLPLIIQLFNLTAFTAGFWHRGQLNQLFQTATKRPPTKPKKGQNTGMRARNVSLVVRPGQIAASGYCYQI